MPPRVYPGSEAISEGVAWRVESGTLSTGVISKSVLWFLAIAVLGVLIVTWWVGGYPARVAIINHNPEARDIVLTAAGTRIAVGTIRGGETRIVKVPSGEPIELRFMADKPRVWHSPGPIAPGASAVIYIQPDGRVDMRDRIGR